MLIGFFLQEAVASGASLCQIYLVILMVWLYDSVKIDNPTDDSLMKYKKGTENPFGVKMSDLLKAWLALLLMETRLMTPASLFLLEAPLPLPDPPVDCDAML